MWHAVTVRKSEGVIKAFEKPLVEHLADKLNELESECGKITMAHLIQLKDEAWAEMLVQTGEQNG